MPQGDKSKYTDKQKRQAEHIEESYKDSGLDEKEAAARAWATVNRQDHGGKMPGGSGRGTEPDTQPIERNRSKHTRMTKKAAATKKATNKTAGAAKKAPAKKAAAKKTPAKKAGVKKR